VSLVKKYWAEMSWTEMSLGRIVSKICAETSDYSLKDECVPSMTVLDLEVLSVNSLPLTLENNRHFTLIKTQGWSGNMRSLRSLASDSVWGTLPINLCKYIY
jgi:hypothetical protein